MCIRDSYLTSLGRDGAEHAQAALTILSPIASPDH